MLCPNCRQSIPDGVPVCRFCKTRFQNIRKTNNRALYISVIALSALVILASALVFILDPWGGQSNKQSSVLKPLVQKQFTATYYTGQVVADAGSSRPSYSDWQGDLKKALGLWKEIVEESSDFPVKTAAASRIRLGIGTVYAADAGALEFLDSANGGPMSDYATLLQADAKTAADTLSALHDQIDASAYADQAACRNTLDAAADALNNSMQTGVLAGRQFAAGATVETENGDILAVKGADMLLSVEDGYAIAVIAEKDGQDITARAGNFDLSESITFTAVNAGGEVRTFKTPVLSEEMQQAVAGLVLDLSDMASSKGSMTTGTSSELGSIMDQAGIDTPDWMQETGGALSGLDTDLGGGGEYDPDMPGGLDLDTFIIGDWEALDYWNSELDENGRYTKTMLEESDTTFIAHFYAEGTVVFDERHNASGDVSKNLLTYSYIVDGPRINLYDDSGSVAYTFYYNPGDEKIYTVNPNRLDTNGTYRTYSKVG